MIVNNEEFYYKEYQTINAFLEFSSVKTDPKLMEIYEYNSQRVKKKYLEECEREEYEEIQSYKQINKLEEELNNVNREINHIKEKEREGNV